MSAKSNLLIFLKKTGIKNSDFYKETGLSNGFLDKNENISSQNIEIIISHYPNLSLNWLITGEGEMLKEEVNNSVAHPAVQPCALCAEKERTIAAQQEIIATQKELITQLKSNH